MATKVYSADRAGTTQDEIAITDTSSNIVINDFDNLSDPDGIHDQIDLTAIFDKLAGTYSDGVDDLKDRIAAVTLTKGDYDNDGMSDDLELTIKGVSNFKIDFIDPAYANVASTAVAAGSGTYDDIAVMSATTAITSLTLQTITTPGGVAIYDDSNRAFAITADGHITVNGVVDPYTNGVTALDLIDGVIYQTAPDPSDNGKTSGWWEYTPGGGWHDWTKTADPTASTSATGTSDSTGSTKTSSGTTTSTTTGTTTASPGGATIYDSNDITFAITADGHIAVNGVTDPYTNGVTEIEIVGGKLYQTAPDPSDGGKTASWWEYTPGSGYHGWTETSDPTSSTSSADTSDSSTSTGTTSNGTSTATGSTDTTGTTGPTDSSAAGTALVTSASPGGATLYDSNDVAFALTSDGHITIDGTVDPYTSGVTKIELVDGKLYQGAPDPSEGGKTEGWWEYTPGSGYHGWTETTDPTAATTTAISTSSSSTSTTVDGLYEGKYPAYWARLSDGIDVERSELSKLSEDDMKYLHDLGVQNFRVFLDPDEYLTAGQSMNPDSNWEIQTLKGFMDKAVAAGIAVVVTPFGNESSASYLTNPNDTTNLNQYLSWMKEFATWINDNYSSQDVFIETRNEPVLSTSAGDAADAQTWWAIQQKFIDVIHQAAPDFTVVASANEWSSPDVLQQMTAYSDKNVVYDIHMYQPMDYTHQGASWVGLTDTSGNPWPGTDGWDANTLESYLQGVKSWADANGAFIYAGEFGAINGAPDRDQYLSDLHNIFEQNGWGWSIWDYDKAFAIANNVDGATDSVYADVQQALDWGKYSNSETSPWYQILESASATSSASSSSSTASSASSTATAANTFSGLTNYVADSNFATSEKFIFSAEDVSKTITITNFDTASGSASGVKDQVDLTAIFDKLGISGTAAREAALHLTILDINGDGIKDVQITIDGASNFHLNLINPNDVHAIDIGSGQGAYDNILVG